MKCQLVIQFPLTDSSADDFDRLLIIENELELILRDKHQVDGHDLGSGEMNMFIHTNDPSEAFVLVKNTLSEKELEIVTVAFRYMDSDVYSVIWPENFNGKFTIK